MAQIDAEQIFNTFVAGMITEGGELTPPENSTLDELNCILFRNGKRRRRLGVDREDSGVVSTAALTVANARDKAIVGKVWTEVAGDGNTNFGVLQMNDTLHFYDLSTEPLSSGKKSFTVDLSTFLASGATDVGSEPVTITSGKGICVVASKKIDPFIIEYSSSGDSITTTAQTITIRDFDGLDDHLNPSEEVSSTGSASAWATSTAYSVSDLVTESGFTYICREAHTSGTFATDLTSGYWGNLTYHEYNLKNQGWESPGEGVADPTATYKTAKSKWPPNNKQWWVGKDSSDDFDSNLLAKYETGNVLAPRGRFLLNAFYKDRSDVSGVSGIAVVSETNRPQVVAFFAGRTWYMGVESSTINGHLFFSQVLTNVEKAGKCYQNADPTGEDLNELVDDDGGVIVIPEIGTVRGAVVKDNFLIIFASNGVWYITGSSQDGFKANDFVVVKASNVGVVGRDTIVETERFPVWWSETGIYTLAQDQVSGQLTHQSLTQNTIETPYQAIPAVSKVYARGTFDPASQRVYWMYNSTAPVNSEDRWKFNRLWIWESSMGSFYPWAISDLDSNTPYLVGALNTQAVRNETNTENVIDSSGNTVVDASSDNVTVDLQTISSSNTFLKWLAMEPDGTDIHWSFNEFDNADFVDWETADGTGANYLSYADTGYQLNGTLHTKQVPYIVVYCEVTETGVSNGALLSPSSVFLQLKWDWTDDPDSGKWTQKVQAYKLKRDFEQGRITAVPSGRKLSISRVPMRGSGDSYQIRFQSENGKDFSIVGWRVMSDDQLP